MNRKQLVLVGAGGHARVVADAAKLSGWDILGFLDDQDPSSFPNMHILGRITEIERYSGRFAMAIGVGSNATRKKIMNSLCAQWETIVHPTAVVSSDVSLGEGTVVLANAVVNPGSELGKGCIINTAATVDHDCIIEDYVHISPGVHLAGQVTIGVESWIGIGAIIKNGVNVCSNTILGAGAVVINNISVKGTYVGVPAKLLTRAVV